MKLKLGIFSIAWLALLFLGTSPLLAKDVVMTNTQGKVRAPEFPQDKQWLNTDRPLKLSELKGKVVLLDFWTYCCINCMHVLPDLKKLEHKYKNELVVIGVHSAKFSNEKETENIRQAILRYEIEHPVVNDSDMQIWQSFAVHAWPTLYLIDPEGKVIGYFSGEGVYEPFDDLIGKVIHDFDSRGLIDRKPITFRLEREKMPESFLSFPGKILADEASQRLFISDSNHNRIVVVTFEGEVQEIIGNGEIGLKGGSFQEAQFHHPQGVALVGNELYVADTENHAIRQIDFEKKTVKTIAGTGEQARREEGLNSPWDVVVVDGNLYIAMAGPHQLWKMNLKTKALSVFAGSGREARIDGPLLQAALAQPSGLTTDGKKLYFADSEVSAIRSADLNPQGRVETIVGEDLFEFGDQDGKGSEVRLQHPLGVVYDHQQLYVADTYNGKIKLIDPVQKTSVTFLKGLDEPAGVSIASGKLFIADTNHHEIKVMDLKTKKVATLELKTKTKVTPPKNKEDATLLPVQTVKSGKVNFVFSLEWAQGLKINKEGPSQIVFSSKNITFEKNQNTLAIEHPSFPLKVALMMPKEASRLDIQLSIYYCEAKQESLCYFKDVHLTLPLKSSDEAPSEIKTSWPIDRP